MLGVVRVTFVVPRLGERWAELSEMPIMAATIYFAAGYILRRFPDIQHHSRSLAVGFLALSLSVCAELGLIQAFDPLREAPPRRGAFLYMRPMVARMGALGVDHMATIATASADIPAYVALAHRSSFRDAERLKETLGSKRAR